MLQEIRKRQRAAPTVEGPRLLALTKDLDQATKALNRLYDAVEKERLLMDETLRIRAHKLKAMRDETLVEIAKLEDRKSKSLPKIDSSSVAAFTEALEARLTAAGKGFGKAYLRLLVDEIRLEGNELKIRGKLCEARRGIRDAGNDEAGQSAQLHR